jgi:hypothetical protein
MLTLPAIGDGRGVVVFVGVGVVVVVDVGMVEDGGVETGGGIYGDEPPVEVGGVGVREDAGVVVVVLAGVVVIATLAGVV